MVTTVTLSDVSQWNWSALTVGEELNKSAVRRDDFTPLWYDLFVFIFTIVVLGN